LFLALGAAVPAAAWVWARWLGLVLLIPLVLSTQARNAVWSDEVALWTEASKASPEVADAWYGLGDARRFSGDFEAAATAYQKAVVRAPEHLEAWNNLGIARAEIGDADAAREAWQAALRVRPSYCKAHNNLGSLAYRRQDWDRAITELRSTLAYCRDSVVAHYLLGRIYDGPRPDRERAIGHYQRVDELDPQFDRIELVRERLMALTF
jgi:tetratricopeptide (TPR) repeat protein